MNTKTKDKTETKAAEPAPAAQVPTVLRLRLPYPVALGEYANVDQRQWGVLIDAIWPSAKTVEGVCMAISYCRAKNYDPFGKMVHIVPVYSKALDREVESVWPGIAAVRTTATRTGIYAGKDASEFGPDITKNFQHVDDRNGAVKKEMEVTFPEWCRVTVYKIVKGVRCAFVGPKVYWEEAYATESRYSAIPNEMWRDRRSGQLEKCAEAASLRAAFPEELGGEMTAEEMHGRVIDGAPSGATAAAAETGEMTPPRPKQSEFERKFAEQERGAPSQGKPSPADKKSDVGDGRPEPPPSEDSKPVETTPAKKVPASKTPEPELSEAEEGGCSSGWEAAETWLTKYGMTIEEMKDLDEFKRVGRVAIDSLENVTDDERDVLRGRFTTLCLTEQQERERETEEEEMIGQKTLLARHPGFHRHWFNGAKRAAVAENLGWSYVTNPKGEREVRNVGSQDIPLPIYAMEISQEVYDAWLYTRHADGTKNIFPVGND